MQAYFSNKVYSYTEQVDTVRRLLDGLVIYRAELGETGRQLELMLRLQSMKEVSDAPHSRQIH